MILIDLGNGFKAVPRDSVTLNGMYLANLNTMQEPYNGFYHVLNPEGDVIDGEGGGPYLYRTLADAQEGADELATMAEYSTCRGVVRNPNVISHRDKIDFVNAVVDLVNRYSEIAAKLNKWAKPLTKQECKDVTIEQMKQMLDKLPTRDATEAEEAIEEFMERFFS